MSRSPIPALVLGLALIGCGDSTPLEPATPTPTPDPAVKLYVFDCGRIRFDTLEAFSVADDESDVREFSVPCYVVEHEQGRLLWDGGLPSLTAEAEGWQGEGMQMRLDRTLAAQLGALDLDMGSFDYLAFSHFHFDHIGVANELTSGTLLIHQAEYDAAFADEVTVPGMDPTIYGGLRGFPREFLGEDHDVFGDGRVRILSAPGHTPGHQVLYVDLDETGPVVLSGDLYHLRISREQRRVPTFNVDAEMTLASMDRIEAFVEETGADFWIEHELAHFETLELAPRYYQ